MEAKIMAVAEAVHIRARRVMGLWVCWRRGYHLDGTTIGHWDDRHRCRDCRTTRNSDQSFTWPYARPWSPRNGTLKGDGQ